MARSSEKAAATSKRAVAAISQPRTALDNKISRTIELLTKVDHLGTVAEALEEEKEKARALNSKQGQSISNSLSCLIEASKQLASEMKKNASQIAPSGDLSYAQKRMSTHHNTIEGTNLSRAQRPKALASIANYLSLSVTVPSSSRKSSPPANPVAARLPAQSPTGTAIVAPMATQAVAPISVQTVCAIATPSEIIASSTETPIAIPTVTPMVSVKDVAMASEEKYPLPLNGEYYSPSKIISIFSSIPMK